jgi:outer membrane protein
MARRTAIPVHAGALGGRSYARSLLFAVAAVSVFTVFGARAEAQEPTPSNLPAGGESAMPPENLPGIVRVQGGWTADTVGARAQKTSFDVAAKQASLRAAEARVATAVVAFFPRLSGLASYTRYQDLSQPSLGTLVEPTTPGPAGPISPTTALSAVPLSFTIPLNYWVFQATLTVPLSDYVLRLTQLRAAASRNAEAARADALASAAKACSDAKIAFYQYVKAVAQRDVLVQSKIVAGAHLVDAENLFQVGRASNADVLATEANVAAAQLAIDQATEMVGVSEEQLRLATHAPPDEPVSIGEDVTSALPRSTSDLAALKREAAANRPEIRSRTPRRPLVLPMGDHRAAA